MSDVFVFIGGYDDADDARLDFSEVKDLYSRGVIDTYDAAVVSKDFDGNVKVQKREKPTEKGAWAGAAVGAVVGALFPPAIVPMAAAGGLTGGLIGHVWHGMSRGDMKDLGDTLDYGKAALVVVGKSSLTDKLEKATAKATKRVERELNVAEKDFTRGLEAEYASMA